MKAKSVSMGSKGITITILLLLGFVTLFFTGCSNSQTTGGQDPPKVNLSQENNANQNAGNLIPDTAKISADEVEAAVNENKGWQLIDVRESREFAAGHIKLAVNRPLGDLEKKITQISKDKEIVLIDLNGTRSESAYQILVKNGYDKNKIKVLNGGMLYWSGAVGSAGSSSVESSNSANNNSNGTGSAAPKPEVQEMVGGC
ncbi:rhodanese-like domain-containing protein [Desulfitobacterium sp.]|uniref:rhodanese-like domain-containing protein n=1 Tax=Desulfitobacterium sp. TaxID=49981 RepID=UPI002B212819|nr:rhodanese-like domain-containing protein [Desulfitobacterium sp.]MEA4902769.1 rhodanese-like domain-containing protein [Desulfitobacterium sp.]